MLYPRCAESKNAWIPDIFLLIIRHLSPLIVQKLLDTLCEVWEGSWVTDISQIWLFIFRGVVCMDDFRSWVMLVKVQYCVKIDAVVEEVQKK